ncbi:heparan-alpha-glucosaminide N-acetyltransferase-like isoform X2 [Oryza brachyantha]|uniref:heparan-alpha-glucosaminide N-acetyltransferase-like isoform X2 n=1 Tax=Oryza brachyantha TaxID=4533 RepID=UPI001AD9720D|nr:heparan-alpha-glucosaminide N-acetyltransferase-like isoform X2 [Oryza brachyantha]
MEMAAPAKSSADSVVAHGGDDVGEEQRRRRRRPDTKEEGGGDGDGCASHHHPAVDVEAGGTHGSDAASAAAAAPPPSPTTTTRRRLVSLDVFRGITVALMILVDDVGGIVPAISHSPWDGVTLADFVFPFFLFIVGVSLAFAYKKVPNKVMATKKAVLRALKLFIVGLILQGGFFHPLHDLNYGVDIHKIRLMGVLQRIAIAYLVVALCEIGLRVSSGGGDIGCDYMLIRRYHRQMLVGLVLVVMYLVILYGLYVPDWGYEVTSPGSTVKRFLQVKCGVRGDTGPGCNAVGMIDRSVLGIQHLYTRPVYLKTKQCSMDSPRNGPLPPDAPSWCEAPFDPEGVLSSLMAIVTCLIGLQIGHVIIHFKKHEERIVRWSIPSLCLLTLGVSLHLFGLHMNKSLYSLSYTCVTTGTAGLFFVVDVKGYKRLAFPMEWMGKHALMIFVLVACNIVPVLVQGFYWKEPRNNLLKLIGIGG